MKLKLLLAAALLPLAGAANAAAFINGSFELGTDPGGFFTQVNAGGGGITGWTVTSGNVDYIGAYWQASNGSRSIDLDGSRAGGLAQTFDTVAGRSYRVTYDIAGNPDGGSAIKSLLVSATGAGNVTDTQTFDTTGRTRDAMGWTQRSYTFRADGGSTTLSFLSNTAGSYGAALDNVAVTAFGGVPEPATWAMMIGGVGLVGGVARRRRQQLAIA